MATAHEAPKEFWFRDPETGRLVTVKGAGSMKGMLNLDPRIDLTKPIFEQVIKLDELDREG